MTARAIAHVVIVAIIALAGKGLAQDDEATPPPEIVAPSVPAPPGPPPAAALAAAAGNGGPTATDKAKGAVLSLPTRELVLDLSVPESPAFEVLGFTPERVTRPTSPRELAANLLNGVDDRGNLQTGIAIDTTPYLLFRGSEVTLTAYRDDYLTRLAARTQFSLGTTKGTSSDDKSVRLGLGLKSTLWDAGDTRYDEEFTDCLMGAHALVHASLDELLDGNKDDLPEVERRFRKAYPKKPEPDLADLTFIGGVIRLQNEAANEAENAEVAQPAVKKGQAQNVNFRQKLAWLGTDPLGREYTERIVLFLDAEGKLQQGQKITEDCFAKAKKRNWNQPSWDLGGALSWISANGQARDLGNSGGAVWTSLALNLPDETLWNLTKAVATKQKHEEYLSDFVREHFQLIMHARYRPDQEVPDASGTGTMKQDTTLVGGRLRIGSPSFAFSAEAAYTYTKVHRMSGDSSEFYSIGGEYRIADDLWLQVSAGSESGNDMGTDQTSILGSIKYGFASSSPFDMWETLKATAQ